MNGPLCCKWGKKTLLGRSIKHWIVSIQHSRSYIDSFYYKTWKLSFNYFNQEYYLKVWKIVNTNPFSQKKRNNILCKHKQSLMSELPWTRALGIWGFATLLMGTCPTTTPTFLRFEFLAGYFLPEDHVVRSGTPTLQGPERSAFDCWATLQWNFKILHPQPPTPPKKLIRREQVIAEEQINTWHPLKRSWTNSDLCRAPTGPSSVWCLFNKHQTADHAFLAVEKGWNVFELRAMTERCHQTSAHSQRRWELTTTNRYGSMCCGGCIWDSFAANHLLFCLFARQFRDGKIFVENRTHTTADKCR